MTEFKLCVEHVQICNDGVPILGKAKNKLANPSCSREWQSRITKDHKVMPISTPARASFRRLFVFASAGFLWLGLMYIVINGVVWVSTDIKLSEIMSKTGDIATVLAFLMVYVKNAFLGEPSLDLEDRESGGLQWSSVLKILQRFSYDALAYVLAWHAIVAIPLRSDWVNEILGSVADEVLFWSIIVSFILAGVLLLIGYREERAFAEAQAD